MGLDVLKVKNSKPISEWTLREVSESCQAEENCEFCEFWRPGGCDLRNVASTWQIYDNEATKKAVKLTEAELAICKAIGAKWVCLGDAGFKVELWDTKPSKTDKGIYVAFGVDPMAILQPYLFPNVQCGELINVEELLK